MSKISVARLLSAALTIAALGVAPAFAANNHKPCNISKDPAGISAPSNGSTKVPEPATMILMGIGAAGLVAGKVREKG